MDFYYVPASAPCRSVLMTADLIGIKLNKKLTNLKAGEQLKPKFLKINPQHTVPTLVDNGFALWESRAIMVYLVEKYGKDDSLFPKCPKKHALVNQRLYFDMGLYAAFRAYYYPQRLQKLPADPELLKRLEAQLEFLNTFLQEQRYVAGNKLTVADLALLATISTIDASTVEFKQFTNVTKWYENCKQEVPGFAENWQGVLEWQKYFH